MLLPISSAAICTQPSVLGLAGGFWHSTAAIAQMVGFAVASYEDNGVRWPRITGVGTSMLQMGSIVDPGYG